MVSPKVRCLWWIRRLFDGTNVQFTTVLKFSNLAVAGEYLAVIKSDTMKGTVDYGYYRLRLLWKGRIYRKEGSASITNESDEIVGLASKTDIEAVRTETTLATRSVVFPPNPVD